MDKSQIISEIKLHLNVKTDYELAQLLGVSQPTVSAWRKRNTLDYELIITKCKIFNAEWLITGKGNPLKKDNPTNEINVDFKELAEARRELLEYKDREIQNLKNKIEEMTVDLEIYSDHFKDEARKSLANKSKKT